MSDYPPTQSYGANYGTPDQQHQSYLPPTYPNPYLPPDNGRTSQAQVAPNYNSNAVAYGYNASIPSFSASALATGVPPLPIFQGWNQDAIPLPPYTSQQPVAQFASYANPQQTPQYYQQVSQPSYQQNVQGELSEGEFEDGAHATNTPPVGYGSAQYPAHDAAGYSDTTQRAFYSKQHDYTPQQPTYPANNYQYPKRANSQLNRQQSGSYSPYISPGGADKNDQAKDNHQYNVHTPKLQQNITSAQSSHSSWQSNSKTNPPQSGPQTNGHTSQEKDKSPNPLPAPAQSESDEAETIYSPTFYLEKRKAAKKAVVDLYSREVAYSAFIEDGNAEDIVGSLFDELHFPRTSSPKSTERLKATTEHEIFTQSHSQTQKNADTSRNLHINSAVGADLPKKPTRRRSKAALDNSTDGINRDNTTTKDGTSSKSTASAMASSSAPSKSAVMTEKERTLLTKMDALRKSREERAQKAAAKNMAKSPTALVPDPPTAASALVVPKVIPPEPKTMVKPSEEEVLSDRPPVAQPLIPNAPSVSRPTIQIPTVQQTPQVPMIPGLFLASVAASPALVAPVVNPTPATLPAKPTPATTLNASTPTPNSAVPRKRPVAADFDEPPKSIAPFKRPFGYSDDNKPDRLVIDVSDEEGESDDEDVAMDLDSQADHDSPVQPPRKFFDQQPAAPPPLTSLPNHQPRKPFTPPPLHSSATNTPPMVSRTLIARPDLLRKETEIEELKKRIAEAEAAKARKKARSTSSGAHTPQVLPSSGVEVRDSTQTNGNLASKVEASLEMQNIIGAAANQVALDQQKFADAQAAEAKKAADIKESQAEQIRLRRQHLESRDAGLETEIQEEQARLDQLTAQVAERRAALQKSIDEKRKIAEEKERLAQEENQLKAQNEKLEDLASNPNGSIDAPPQSSVPPAPGNSLSSRNSAEPSLVIPSHDNNTAPNATLEVETQKAAEGGSSSPVLTNGHNHDSNTDEPASEINKPIVAEAKDTVSTDQALDSALQEAIQAEADAHSHEDGSMEIETSYAPNPNQLAPEPLLSQAEGSQSPIYSPTLERSMPDLHEDTHEDDYEPPEATAPMNDSSINTFGEDLVDNSDGLESPPFSPAPPDSIHVPESQDHEMNDINSGQSGDEGELQDQTQPPAQAQAQPEAEELLPRRNGSLPKLIESGVEHNKIPYFTPYESPLKVFRKYRFHPEYMKQVPSGLKSITYSHKINLEKEFCRYELAGGICNDTTCDLQHFKDIVLPDDAILSALGSPDEFKGEQRDRFCDGLKEVLMDLRLRKIRDFDVIAAEICTHRAKFLGDPSKILALQDVDNF